jgi:hypothetical protein
VRFGDRSGLRRSRLRQVCERPRSRPADHRIQTKPRREAAYPYRIRFAAIQKKAAPFTRKSPPR